MFEESGSRVLAAHFDGERLVLDEPFDLPIGVPLEVRIRQVERKPSREEWLEAFNAFSGSGKNLPRLEDKYLDDRDTYYEGRC
ncbi:hypothetical protein EON79_07355 [bacterium]|nr:MAG: hypothetical protein EON79_07355 [bacterium]